MGRKKPKGQRKQGSFKQTGQQKKSSQPPQETVSNPNTIQHESASENPSQSPSSQKVKPEHMSLTAHKHIQGYLEQKKKEKLDTNDLNAVLRLSQHLRVFGLLSAVGYINQTNEKEDEVAQVSEAEGASNEKKGKVRERTVPVWESLLRQLLDLTYPPAKDESKKKRKKTEEKEENMSPREELMEKVTEMAKEYPVEYMSHWRRALVLSNHWNFWARAYSS